MPKAAPPRSLPGSKRSGKPARHDPLHVSLNSDENLAKFGRISSKALHKQEKREKDASRTGGAGEDAEGEGSIGVRVEGTRMSKKILDLAREQREELEGGSPDEEDMDQAEGSKTAARLSSNKNERSTNTRQTEEEEDDDEDADSFVEGDIEEEYEELEIDPEDYETLNALSSGSAIPQSLLKLSAQSLSDGPQGSTVDAGGLPIDDGADGEPRTLADLIFAKMEESQPVVGQKVSSQAEKQIQMAAEGGRVDPTIGLNPKVVEVYTKVGHLLSRYKSGPLPRALKILPSLPQWAQLLAITDPPRWTPHATYACTKIFVSNLKPEEVKVFLQGILLDQVRDNMMDLQKSKSGKTGAKLDVQLYEALKKSLYKPAAFFKGILFPLCEQGCSLKEATVVASVLSKVSVPVLHSAAALMRLASMDYAGPNSLFIRVLLDKKYALPYKVVDALVFHFIRLANSNRSKDGPDKLPVLWHQSLLVFVQRYGSDLTPDQKDALLDVVRARPHPQISAEIRRELVNSVVRGEPRPEEGDVEMR